MALNENPIFGARNLVDHPDTVITSAHEDADLPAANLALPELDEPFQTADATGTKTVTIDFGSEKTWQALALVNGNFDPDTRMTVLSGDSVGNYTTIVTGHYVPSPTDGWPPALGVRYPMVYVHPTPLTSRYVEFQLSLASTLTFYGADRAFCGPIKQPERGVLQYGYRLSYDQPVITQRTPRGVAHRTNADVARVLRITVDGLKTDEALNSILPAIELEVGRAGDLLIIPRYTATDTLWHDTLWGYLSASEGAEHPNWDRWRHTFTFTERI